MSETHIWRILIGDSVEAGTALSSTTSLCQWIGVVDVDVNVVSPTDGRLMAL